MTSHPIKFVVTIQCTGSKGDVIEPGKYLGTRADRSSINAKGGKLDPVFILERERPAFPVDVSDLVKNGVIQIF